MRCRSACFFPFALLWLLSTGCKCEGPGVKKALDKFMGFAKGEDQTEDLAIKPSAYKVRSRREESHGSRSRITADVEVDPGIDHATLKTVLRDACHDDSIARGASALRVIAWPGKLQRLVNPLGTGIFARDGHGWEGTGVGFEEIHVALSTPEQLHARGLALLSEKEYLKVMTVDRMLGRGKSLEEAVQTTATYHEIPVAEVHAAIRHAQDLFGKPSN
jgi:hypothetical protein